MRNYFKAFCLFFLMTITIGTIAIPTSTVTAAEDERTMVELSKADQVLFLIEMRTVLESLHNVMLALDDNDMAAVAEAAQSSKSRIKKKSHGLLKKLPPDFKIFSKAVRKGFVQIAKAANSGANKDKIISLMGEQLGRCVACHATYRIR